MSGMREALIAVMIFLCLAAAPLASMAVWPRLPARHRDDDTNNVVRLAANLFGVMTSLVLGLMINSAKQTFESIDHNVHAYATEMILLDRVLRQYGPDTDTVRASRSISSEPKRMTLWPPLEAAAPVSPPRRSTARMRASNSRGSKGLGR